MSRIHIAGSLLLGLFAIGCSAPKITDSSTFQAFPGQGIKNIVELGMPFSKVKNTTGELVAETTSRGDGPDYYVFGADVPSMGIHLSGWEHKPAKVCQIAFQVDPDATATRFFGFIGGLSFASGQRVVREDVVRLFGEPAHDLGAPPGYTNTFKFVCIGESVSAWYSKTSETLWYPTNGVTFHLESNTVRRVMINWKVEPSVAPLPRDPYTGHSDGER